MQGKIVYSNIVKSKQKLVEKIQLGIRDFYSSKKLIADCYMVAMSDTTTEGIKRSKAAVLLSLNLVWFMFEQGTVP